MTRTTFLKLALLSAAMAGLVRPLTAQSETELFVEWNREILHVVSISNTAPCLTARNLAIIHGAAFDAVNAQMGMYRNFEYDAGPPRAYIPEVGMIAAFEESAKILFPAQSAVFARLRENQFSRISNRVAGNGPASIEYGRACALAHVRAREGDGSAYGITYIPRDEPGKWRRTPPLHRPPETPHWGQVRPFLLRSADQFRPDGPPALESEEYAAALNEIIELGRVESPWRTDDDTESARFWACFSYTSTPAGHWNEIAGRIALERHMGLEETARLFLLMNLATADAGIAAWDAKYHYEFWRPMHANARALEDGNPATEPVLDWKPMLESPPHPEYVSGHSSFSGAAARLLARFFGTDRVSFAATSSDVPGVVRRYESLNQCAQEIGMSRLYGGIHFRFSNEDGLELGARVADWTFDHALQTRELSRVAD